MNYNILTGTTLFQGLSNEEAESILNKIHAFTKQYQKEATVYRTGEFVTDLGLVLSGRIHIEFDDVWGNKNIIDYVDAGQVFAETYAFVPEEPLMVNVIAASDAEILFLNMERLLSLSSGACPFHHRLLCNMLSVTARKNLTLTRKIFHTSPKSIRGKLLSYLSFQAVRQGSRGFEIPLNRQQLADYLEADRSALSNELSKMRKEGLLTFRKNYFQLSVPTPGSPSGQN